MWGAGQHPVAGCGAMARGTVTSLDHVGCGGKLTDADNICIPPLIFRGPPPSNRLRPVVKWRHAGRRRVQPVASRLLPPHAAFAHPPAPGPGSDRSSTSGRRLRPSYPPPRSVEVGALAAWATAVANLRAAPGRADAQSRSIKTGLVDGVKTRIWRAARCVGTVRATRRGRHPERRPPAI